MVAQAHPGVDRRKEPAGPESRPSAQAAPGAHDDESRQILGLGSETVDHPGAQTWAAGLGESGVKENLRRSVVELVGANGTDQADVIDDFPQMWEDLRDFRSGLAMTSELEAGTEHGGIGPDEGVALTADDRGR